MELGVYISCVSGCLLVGYCWDLCFLSENGMITNFYSFCLEVQKIFIWGGAVHVVSCFFSMAIHNEDVLL